MPTPDASRPPENGLERVHELVEFAGDQLGGASQALLCDPAAQALALARLRNGYDVEDAVLSQVHAAMGRDSRLADEFLAYFLRDLLRLGHRVKSTALKRFLDTGDLVQSVLGDLWSDIASVRFETRSRYLAYLARKLRWKASNRTRALEAAKRSEHKRHEQAADELELEHAGDSPATAAAKGEDLDRLALVLMKLPERDKKLLTLHLRGLELREIAQQMGLSYDAARMALDRAVRRARRLA